MEWAALSAVNAKRLTFESRVEGSPSNLVNAFFCLVVLRVKQFVYMPYYLPYNVSDVQRSIVNCFFVCK